ncbi:MAG: hypothetical protein HC808_13370 [Candidatus Competibacteraceae bacterium]|nr:hypothetical protein [Candidatus Competibacteraceae bacterium]
MTPTKTLLPVNSFLSPPQVGGIFTSTFTVRVERADGTLFPAENISVDLISPDDTGALVYLNGDEENQDDDGNELFFRRLVFEETSGIATGHFHAFSAPGTANLEASVSDPDTGRVDSARIQITVGSGASTGQPSLIGFQFDAGPLFITGQGQIDVKLMNIFVLDDAGIEVPNPTANNVRLELLPGAQWRGNPHSCRLWREFARWHDSEYPYHQWCCSSDFASRYPTGHRADCRNHGSSGQQC